MAGRGSRFADTGYILPKPLIHVHDKPMIAWVIKNFSVGIPCDYTFVALRQHETNFNLSNILKKYVEAPNIVWLDEVTSGAAETCVLGTQNLPADASLVIANSDQFIAQNLTKYMQLSMEVDGLIMTMPNSDPKWSYVSVDKSGNAVRIVDKEVISSHATTGIYSFKTVNSFVEAANQMIASGEKTNGEYYVAPVFNRLIETGKLIRTYDVGKKMHGIGTPSDLKKFENWIKSSQNYDN